MSKTIILPAQEEAINRGAEILRKGSIVAFPTETVYGLGGDARSGEAVHRLYAVKNRPLSMPLSVLVANFTMAHELAHFPPLAKSLAERFWPGPLTLILRRKDKARLTPHLSAGLSSIGLRMPDHKVALSLIDACGFPLAAPSANRTGQPSPHTAEEVLVELEGKIDLLLDGGTCAHGEASTIVALEGDHTKILRQGALGEAEIRGILT